MTKIKKLKEKKSRVKKKSEITQVQISLPTKPRTPSKHIEAYSFLIYGPKKIGKTSMLSKAGFNDKEVFFAMFEPGAGDLRIYERPMNNWKEFKMYVSLLLKSNKFGAIIIDTADIAYDMCLTHVCKKLGIEHPSDLGYGKGWDKVKKEFTGEINKLVRSKLGVFFVSHAKKDEIFKRTGGSWHEVMPTLSGQARSILEAVVDVWIYYDYTGDKRVMKVIGSEERGAGHRLTTKFRYTNGKMVRQIPGGNSPQEAWDNVVLAFHNELEEPKRKGGAKKKRKRKGLRKKG